MTFLNRPGGFRRRRWRRLGANVGTGFRKRKRQLRARWRPARETPKKPDVLHPASADHQHLSLSRQRPLLATAAECRAGTKLVEFDDRISELASNIDEARRHRDLKLRGWTIELIRADARLVGPATAALCELILEQRPHPEQGFRACLGVVGWPVRMAPSASKPPPSAPSTSAHALMARSNPSSTTTSTGDPRKSAPRTERRWCAGKIGRR